MRLKYKKPKLKEHGNIELITKGPKRGRSDTGTGAASLP